MDRKRTCSAEGSGGRIRSQEGAKDIGDANGNHLLRRVDRVVVDAAERLGDGDMFDEEDNNARREIWQQSAGEVVVEYGHRRVLEACREQRQSQSSSKGVRLAGGRASFSIPRGTVERILNLTFLELRFLLTR